MPASYIASLLHLRASARTFCAAFQDASTAAQAFDPGCERRPPEAEAALLEIAAQLRTLCAFIPGARECLALALAPELKE